MLAQTVVETFFRDRCSKTKQHRNHESGRRAERHNVVLPTLIEEVGVGTEGAVGDEDVGRCKYKKKTLAIHLNFVACGFGLILWFIYRCDVYLFVGLDVSMTVLLCS